MGIIAWIALGMAVGLLVNMLLPGKRSRALIFLCSRLLHRGPSSQPVPRARSVQFSLPGSPPSPKQRSCCWPATCSPSVGPRDAAIEVGTVGDTMASDPRPIAPPVDPCDSGVT